MIPKKASSAYMVFVIFLLFFAIALTVQQFKAFLDAGVCRQSFLACVFNLRATEAFWTLSNWSWSWVTHAIGVGALAVALYLLYVSLPGRR